MRQSAETLSGHDLSIPSLLKVFGGRVALTWGMILAETALMAMVPLFIGFAIDGLLSGSMREFWQLAAIAAGLVATSMVRRIYDTRIYGTLRVEFGKVQVQRGKGQTVSTLNARLGMGRELVDFLEETLPEAIGSGVQLVISIIILYAFSPALALAGIGAVLGMVCIYALFHGAFYRLNGQHNQQVEKQVHVLEKRSHLASLSHLTRLRRLEVRVSDTEAVLYGLIFVVLISMILFNIWFATTALTSSVGTIFSIVSYSWEFVESALALPITLQSWSRLSEITQRLNASE